MARIAGSIGAETADRVREQSLKLFAAKGYAAVSMREIAAAVGVQAAALYNHFPNKQALLADLMLSHMDGLLAAWDSEAVAGEAPAEALQRLVRFHIRYHAGRSDAVFISYMELRSLEPENFMKVEKLRQTYEGVVQSILEQGVEAGVFRVEDTRICAMAIIAMLAGVNTWYRQKGRLNLSQIEGIYTDMVLRVAGAGRREDLCSAAE
jgi:AcrR family transcriptional regulator